MSDRLVTTGQAARALGIDSSTLARWARSGMVKPDLVTAGGHARWDVDRLRAELQEMRERDE
ncbi:MAG: MerR family transcriptional regulator [Pseudonocardiaceae bacterium]|nr:MerR family transcriptional regulator [Pseudonocardiaceae bacterium]